MVFDDHSIDTTCGESFYSRRDEIRLLTRTFWPWKFENGEVKKVKLTSQVFLVKRAVPSPLEKGESFLLLLLHY